ncbi:MAG TPA: hypothetical protein VN577_19335 [Terriglobales bacterium]|nr:hypothetical protein [Terriglobales bacterium]
MSKYIRGLFLAVSVVALAGLLFAQKIPKYDKTAEVKLSTVIEEVKTITADNGQQRIYFVVKDGTEVFEVYLAPKAFIDDMSAEFTKGDKVDITGSKIKGEKAIILAREVVNGNNTLVLRDKAGEPVWTWMEKSTAVGK